MDHLDEIRRVAEEAELLYSEAEVEAAIARLGREIARTLADANPVLLTVLNGGIIFAGKLLTHLDFPLELDSIQATRYQGQTQGSGLRWLHKPSIPLSGRAVLIMDDVLDEGITLAEVANFCRAEGAKTVCTAVLVDKDLGTDRPCQADFVGLKAPNRYLFGYGMDYRSYLRNAAGVYACAPAQVKEHP